MLVDRFEKYYHYFHKEGYVFHGHRHNSYEVNIVLDGCLEVTCDDSVCRLSVGELCIWEPGVFHRNRVVSDGVTEFISLHFCSADVSFHSPSLFTLGEHDIMLVKVLDDELKKSSGRITLASQNLLEALLLRLEGKTLTPSISQSKCSAIYHTAVKVMNENIGESLDVPRIAKLCGVCSTNIKNAFAECAGKGVKEYFLEMKLEKAKQMLLRDVPISTVSNTLGFSSPAYFSQCFKRKFSMSASEYKKESASNH